MKLPSIRLKTRNWENTTKNESLTKIESTLNNIEMLTFCFLFIEILRFKLLESIATTLIILLIYLLRKSIKKYLKTQGE